MSVTTVVTATPNRVEIITGYLKSCGERGVARADLIAQLSPPALYRSTSGGPSEEEEEQQSNVAPQALDETLRLGLAEYYDADNVQWVRYVPSQAHEPEALFERLEMKLLDPQVADGAGQREFRRALAWLLTQDPVRPLNFRDNVRSQVEAQCGTGVNAFELTSASRSQNFYYWARYLGYAWHVSANNTATVIIPDPTGAIERLLPRLLSPGETRPLAQVVDAWAERSSVLEGGAARSEVEELMSYRGGAPPRLEGSLSRSTSLALERLDRRGVIHLERQADAPAMLLSVWPDPLPISHITYLRTA